MAITKCCPFRIFSIPGKRWMPQCHYIVLGTVLFGHKWLMIRCIVMQKKQAVSFPFFCIFPPQCILEMMGDSNIHFLAYSMFFWNKFIVNKTISITRNLQHNLAFALVEAGLLFPRWFAFLLAQLTFRLWVIQKALSFISGGYFIPKISTLMP